MTKTPNKMESPSSIEEAIFLLNVFFHRNYGIQDAITKIGLCPEAFEQTIIEAMKRNPYYTKVGNLGELFISGIQILSRRKDNF